MSTVNLAPVFNALDGLGAPLAGGMVYVFQAGTTTPAAVYQDAALTTPHPHPLTLDASGNATIYWPVGVYRIRVTTSAGVLEWEVDDYAVASIEAAAQASGGLLANGSFEALGSGGAPAGWTLTPDASGSVAQDTAAPAHGDTALKFISPGGGASGGGIANSDPFPVTDGAVLDVAFMLKTSAATLRVAVDVPWFDAAMTQIASTTVYDNATTNPANWTAYAFTATAPAGARFARVLLHGGIAGASAPAGSVWIDAVSAALRVDATLLGGLTAGQFVRSDANTDIAGNPTLANDSYLRGRNPAGEVTRLLGAAGNGKVYMGAVDTTPTPITEVITRVNGADALVVTATTATIGGVPVVKNTDVIPVATGGTGAGDAVTARANLGVGITLAAGNPVALALPAAGSTSVTAQGAHGLGAVPDFYRVRATCLTTEFGYAVGDVVDLSAGFSERDWGGSSGGNTLWTRTMTIAADATNVYAAYLSGENVLPLLNRTTGAYVSATPANWSVDITPYRFQA